MTRIEYDKLYILFDSPTITLLVYMIKINIKN